MAQAPVANALTLELEPVVADNLARHLDTADEWYAHDYVPFDQGENFALLHLETYFVHGQHAAKANAQFVGAE